MAASSPAVWPKIQPLPAVLRSPRNLLNPTFTTHFDPSAP